MLRRDHHLFLYLFIFVLLLFIISFFVSGFFGTADLGSREVFRVIKYKLWDVSAEDMDLGVIAIVWDLRIPRALLAIAVGGGLAVAGAGMQAVTQNILAEPYMLGVSSGALTAVAAMYFFFADGDLFIRSGDIDSSICRGSDRAPIRVPCGRDRARSIQ